VGRRQNKKKPTYKPKKPKVESSEPPLLVFVSSVMNKLKEERDTIYHTIHSMQLARPWVFEYTPASSQSSVEIYLSKVRECDIFLLLLGSEYSQPVVHEYETAVESGKPVLLFIHTGNKDEKQKEFIDLLRPKYKYGSFTKPEDLHDVVYVSVLDEIIRTFRNAIRPSDTPRLIEHIPLATPESDAMSGYFVIGVDEDQTEMTRLFKAFGATTPPEELTQLDSSLEPIYFKNVAELNEATNIVTKAHERAQKTSGDKQRVFFRELKRESLEVASKRMMRQQANEPEPEIGTPGINYFIWGQPPDFARLYKLIRFEGMLKEPVQVKRVPSELLFRSAKRYTKVADAIQRSLENAQGNYLEFLRLLGIEAAMIDDDDEGK
jgi:hypothetical protein